MSFKEIDARLNLFFLCKIFHLKTTSEIRRFYVEQAVRRLTKEESQLISKLYIDPREQRAYFEAQNLPKDNVIDIYYRKDIRDIIQAALKKVS